MRPNLLPSFALLAVMGAASPARAQAIRSKHSTDYWVANSALTLGFGVLGFGATYIPGDPMVDAFWFGPDRSVTHYFSTTAASASDVLLVGELVGPVVGLGVGTSHAKFTDGMLVYAQAQSASFALYSLTKYAVRRPRPYTYDPSPAVRREHNCARIEDDCLSFYSGHASAAFTAAFAGGYLVNETVDMSQASHALSWGVLMAGAAATAHLRVRAGKHFYTDVVTGAVLGAAAGVIVPLVHGGRYVPSALDVGAGAAGLFVGTAAPLLVPSDAIPRDALLEPWVVEDHGVGLALGGTW